MVNDCHVLHCRTVGTVQSYCRIEVGWAYFLM